MIFFFIFVSTGYTGVHCEVDIGECASRGVAHLISHGSVREKYLLSFNRESEKSEKKVRNNTGEIFLMVHPGKEWATPRAIRRMDSTW